MTSNQLTNLEALIYAFGWNGGTCHQFDAMFRPSLDNINQRSITSLTCVDFWIDLIIAVAQIQPGYSPNIKKAYLARYQHLGEFESMLGNQDWVDTCDLPKPIDGINQFNYKNKG